MNIIKKILRGVYYFCVGLKTSFHDFYTAYAENQRVPAFLRSKAALALSAVVVVAAGWGLVAAIGSAGATERHPLPASAPQSEAPSAPSKAPDKPASAAPDAASTADAPSAASAPVVDAMASATRYAPISGEQLSTALTDRAKQYYEKAAASGVVFVPPAAGDIAGWKAVNPDVVGWISISNTNINYPLVIGQYTDYYTHRGYYKEPSRNGVIWFDSDTRFDANGNITSTNAVLYGHNWTNCWRPIRIGNPNDVMFAQLAAYDDAGFTAQNPYIRIATTGGESLYQVFAVFYTDLSFAYNYAELPAGNVTMTMQQMVDKAISMSVHKLGVSVNAKTDKIITLSTCTRVLGAGDNQRFVVMAKKVS